MIREYSYRLIALFMVTLMFSTSVGLSINIHYCGDELKSIAFFGEAEKCEMEKSLEKKTQFHCNTNDEKTISSTSPSIDQKNCSCCKDKVILIENTDDIESVHFSETQVKQLLVLATIVNPYHTFFGEKESQFDYLNYISPPLIKDFPILHQSFLI